MKRRVVGWALSSWLTELPREPASSCGAVHGRLRIGSAEDMRIVVFF